VVPEENAPRVIPSILVLVATAVSKSHRDKSKTDLSGLLIHCDTSTNFFWLGCRYRASRYRKWTRELKMIDSSLLTLFGIASLPSYSLSFTSCRCDGHRDERGERCFLKKDVVVGKFLDMVYGLEEYSQLAHFVL